jgi:hypothetical protein
MAYREFYPMIRTTAPSYPKITPGVPGSVCAMRAPDSSWRCSLLNGHTGAHIALGDIGQIYADWLDGDTGPSREVILGVYTPNTIASFLQAIADTSCTEIVGSKVPAYSYPVDDWDLLEDVSFDEAQRLPTLETLPPAKGTKR